MSGPVPPSEVLARFLRVLGMAPEAVPPELSERAAMLRTLASTRRLAILLDDAASAAQVRALLPGSTGCVTVVTARNELPGLVLDGARLHHLGLLEATDALELLGRAVGKDRVEQELVAARQVVGLCARLPLAVCVAAAKLATRPGWQVRRMAEALRDEHHRLEVLAVDDDEDTAVHAALHASYRSLPPSAARAYRTLGVFPLTWFDSPSLAASLGCQVAEAARQFDRLVSANLLEESGSGSTGGRYRFHDLVRLHASSCARSDERPDHESVATDRLLDYVLATATEAERLLSPSHRTMARDHRPTGVPVPFCDASGALGWLDEQRAHLMALIRYAAAHDRHAIAWQLVDAAWPLFLRKRYYEEWIEAHRIGLSSARALGDTAAVGRMLTSGATALRHREQLDEARRWYTEALALYEDAGDQRGQAQACNALGKIHRDQGRLEEARRHFAAALRLREQAGYPRGVALSRHGLGEVALARGDLGQAASLFGAARDELAALGDGYDAARSQALLGCVESLRGRHEIARNLLGEAAETFRVSGSPYWQAKAEELLGRSCRETDDVRQARDHYRSAYSLYASTSPDEARRLACEVADLM